MAKKIIFTEEQEKEIINFYLVPNSLRETSRYFNIKNRDVIKNILIKYDIPFHSQEVCMQLKQQKAIKTNLEKYGVTNTYQLPEIREKAQKAWKDNEQEIRKKMQQTSLERHGDPFYHNQEQANKTRLEKYGVINFFQDKKIHEKALEQSHSPEALEKKRQTCQEHFGTDTPLESKEVWEKINKTVKEKYGVDYITQNSEIQNKIKQTNLEKYGETSYTKTEEYKERVKQTNLEKYGYESPLQSPEVKEKAKNTNLQRYGVDNYTKTAEYLQKTKTTNLEKYGVEFANQSEQIKLKVFETKQKNHSFNSSKQEDLFYEELLKIFNKEDVFKQYNTKKYENSDRYPFACDFYIKSLDLFIELNLMWTHGNHRFNENNQEDINILAVWQEQAKTSKFYKNAIDVWTIRDIKKFEIAEKNNLNYVTLYNKEDINKLLEDFKNEKTEK